MTPPPFILASASPRRAQLLREMEFDFEVVASHAPEAEHEHLSARELAQLNAYRKANAVAKLHPQAVVLGADTVVCLGNRFLGKPANRAGARRMLAALSGQTHVVVTGCCLMRRAAHHCRIFCDQTSVTFRRLGGRAIARYLKTINPLDKAGAYAIQESGEQIVARIEGSFTNVVGLPTEALWRELKAFGFDD